MYSGIAKVVEVVRQYLAAQSHGDTLSTLGEEQRELGRERDRLLVTTIVRELPVGGLRVEDHVECEFGKTSLDITRGSGTVAGEDVSPVALCVDEEVFLSHLHQGVTDGSITVRVKLHGVSHDVRHLVVSSIVHSFHGVEDTSLHRFETVLDVRNGTLQDDIRSIVEEPVLVHAAEMVYSGGVKSVHRLVV